MKYISIIIAFLGISNIYDSITKLTTKNYYHDYYTTFNKQTLLIRNKTHFLIVNYIGIILGVLLIILAIGLLKKKKFSYYLAIFLCIFYTLNISLSYIYHLATDKINITFTILTFILLAIFILILRNIIKNKDDFINLT